MSNNRNILEFPKFLFENEKYKNISNDAKLLYMLLLNRFKNPREIKINKNCNQYINFTRLEAMNFLNVHKATISKIFKELKENDLIIEKKVGLGEPNMIIIKLDFL